MKVQIQMKLLEKIDVCLKSTSEENCTMGSCKSFKKQFFTFQVLYVIIFNLSDKSF